MIYLDYNATTPVHPEVRRAIHQFLDEEFGNPSSSHAKGQVAAQAVALARQALAQAIGAQAGQIVFTASATEANNLAILGACAALPADKRHVVVSAIEHPAVLEPAWHLQRQGWKLSIAPVSPEGVLDLPALQALLAMGNVGLVSVMYANNELGSIQPIAQVAQLSREYGAILHVDAAQAMGKIELDVTSLGIDLLSLAGHKMYAPKGIGVLYIRTGIAVQNILYGASQEAGLRPGTENVAYIVGMGVAAGLVTNNEPTRQKMACLRDRLQTLLSAGIPGLQVNGSVRYRLPNTLHVSLPHGSGHAMVARLGEVLAFSTGSACHADGAPSGVMHAIGASSQQALGALRLSLGYASTEEEIERAAHLIIDAYRQAESAPVGCAQAEPKPNPN